MGKKISIHKMDLLVQIKMGWCITCRAFLSSTSCRYLVWLNVASMPQVTGMR